MISLERRGGRREMALRYSEGRNNKDLEVEEGEACSYPAHNDDQYDPSLDIDVALSYIDEKIQDVLGHFQKDFEGGVSAESLGPKYGGYGSFLPTYQWSPHPPATRSPKRQPHVPREPSKPWTGQDRSHGVGSSTSAPPAATLPASPPSLQASNRATDLIRREGNLPYRADPTSHAVGNKKPALETDAKLLKVRVKVGSDRTFVPRTDTICDGLGLGTPSSSSMGGSPAESEGLLHESRASPTESPGRILQVMASFPLEEGELLSPLSDDLVQLAEMKRLPEGGLSKLAARICPARAKHEAKTSSREKLKEKPDIQDGTRLESDRSFPRIEHVSSPKKPSRSSNSNFSHTDDSRGADAKDSSDDTVVKPDSSNSVKEEAAYRGIRNDQARSPGEKPCAKMPTSRHELSGNSTGNGPSSLRNKEKGKPSQNHPITENARGENKGSAPISKLKKREHATGNGMRAKLKNFVLKEKSEKAQETYTSLFGDLEPEDEPVKDSVRRNGSKVVIDVEEDGTKNRLSDGSYAEAVSAVQNPESDVSVPANPAMLQDYWVCCDRCQKWRLLPLGKNPADLPEKWLCSMLDWLPGMNHCSHSEEETTNALVASYQIPPSDKSAVQSDSVKSEIVTGSAEPHKNPKNSGFVNKSHVKNSVSAELPDTSKSTPMKKHTGASVAGGNTIGENDAVLGKPAGAKSRHADALAIVKQQKLKNKIKSFDSASAGDKFLEMKVRDEEDEEEDCFRVSKKARIDRQTESSVPNFPIKNQLRPNSMTAPKNLRPEKGDPAPVPSKKPKQGGQILAINGRAEASKHDGKAGNLSLGPSVAKNESEEDGRRAKKPRVSKSEGNSLYEEPKRLAESDTVKNTGRGACQESKSRNKNTISRNSGVRDSSSADVASKTPSNSSRLSAGSQRAKAGLQDAKCSPVNSISSSPKKASNLKKPVSARSNLASDDNDNGSDQSGASTKDKLSRVSKTCPGPLNHDSRTKVPGDGSGGCKARAAPSGAQKDENVRRSQPVHRDNQQQDRAAVGTERKKVQNGINRGDSNCHSADGNVVRGSENASTGIRDSSSRQTAECALKEARNLKHMADRMKNSGSSSESTRLYFEAALKFIQGAFLLETRNIDKTKTDDVAQSVHIYTSTANLCEFCAREYEKSKDMAAATLAYKCMEVAHMRVTYSSRVNANKDMLELQKCMPLVSQGESPSSSASDIDNLNVPCITDKAHRPINGFSPTKNLTIAAQYRPNITRLFDYSKAMVSAMEASRKSHAAFAATNATSAEPMKNGEISSIKAALDFNFMDVEGLLRLVRLALEAISH